MSDASLYERLGEREGIRAVVDDFYDRLVADPTLGPFFEGADLEKLRRTQTDFLCEAAGGPETYDAEPVREAHLQVPFEPAHIERAVELLEASGSPSEEILEHAAEYDVDQICVGGRKRSPAGKALFGSVTQDVILGTHKPVLVCGSEEEDEE